MQNLVRLDSEPEFKKGLWFQTQIGLQGFSACLSATADETREKDRLILTADNFYEIKPGSKYQLDDEIREGPSGALADQTVIVPGDYVNWGGGGVNVSVFARAIAPNPSLVPIKYTDIATSDTLGEFRHDFQETDARLKELGPLDPTDPTLIDLWRERFSKTIVKYVPERSLESFLSSLSIDVILHRPAKCEPRRNLVISRIRGGGREVDNKIVCRGKVTPLDDEQMDVPAMLGRHADNVGAVILNSVKDRALFEAAYSFYKQAYARDQNTLGLLAMTEPMLRYTEWMMEQAGGKKLPPHILIFNEKEFFEFAAKFSDSLVPFMDTPSVPPHVKRFIAIGSTIRELFRPKDAPRIYVTLGPYGSMGIDRDGWVLYVSGFLKPRATIFDTNACGDAYSAAIALLEWGKRHGYPNLAPWPGGTENDGADVSAMADHKEMIYFMSVATAAAYSRATNRHGRVDTREIQDLLEHVHLASLQELVQVDTPNERILREITDRGGRLKTPTVAKTRGVTDDLRRLMSIAPS